jgi:DNA polymerase-3 subunit epsilon
MREIVFDTETTGRDAVWRDPKGNLIGDRIVEIGCVELYNLAPTGRTLHLYLNPQRDVPDEVVRVHGLTTTFLKDKALFAHVVEDILAFFGDAPLIAHNSEFDRKFVNAELELLGRPPLPQSRCVDTLPMARKKFPGAANSLDALAKRFELDRYGFDLSARKGAGGHGALIDAKILAEVYLQLKGGREQALAFEQVVDIIEDVGGGAAPLVFTPRAQRPAPLASPLTAEELAAHIAFVAKLGGGAPIWKKFLDAEEIALSPAASG